MEKQRDPRTDRSTYQKDFEAKLEEAKLILSNKWVGANSYPYRKKFGVLFTLHTNINSRWTKNLHMKSKFLKLPEANIQESL